MKFICIFRFIESSGVKILEQNLYRNFVAHLSSLEKMEIIGAGSLLRYYILLYLNQVHSFSKLDIYSLHSKVQKMYTLFKWPKRAGISWEDVKTFYPIICVNLEKVDTLWLIFVSSKLIIICPNSQAKQTFSSLITMKYLHL